MELKKEIRAEVRRRIKELSAEQMTSASKSIFHKIEQLEAFKQARCIMQRTCYFLSYFSSKDQSGLASSSVQYS